MSEEEILKECTELAENEHHELGDCWDEEYSSSAIFGLIMLYKQTKKELNNLKERNELFVASGNSINLERHIKNNYISKDKIRKKLEYQNMLWNTPNRQKEYNQEFAEFLEELLLEEK